MMEKSWDEVELVGTSEAQSQEGLQQVEKMKSGEQQELKKKQIWAWRGNTSRMSGIGKPTWQEWVKRGESRSINTSSVGRWGALGEKETNGYKLGTRDVVLWTALKDLARTWSEQRSCRFLWGGYESGDRALRLVQPPNLSSYLCQV